jgi:parvulin-like peptidyl-prolyl isomerase
MIRIVNFEGVKATVRNTNYKFFTVAILAALVLISAGCPSPKGPAGETPDGNETAATINGKVIKLEEIERTIKQQAQGQEAKLSQLELAQARLQVLEQLIQQEVMFQKAESEKTIPTDEEVAAELNKMKTQQGVSKEEWEKRMKQAGITEETLKDTIKKQLAIQKLVDKITAKVEPPSDSEIEAFYNGNKAAFVKKRGVKLAAIVVDPRDSGQGDKTTDEDSAKLKVQEILKKISGGADFATLASSESEDSSRLRKGDLGYISEDQMKQTFSPQIAQAFMDDNFKVGGVTPAIPIAGKFYIFKLQDKVEKDEAETLETPGVRQRITDSLVQNRKQILSASYAAVAMNEAKIVNYLAQKVVDNPNELSGARPASASDDAKKDEKSESNAADANTGKEEDSEKKDDAEAKSDEKKDETKADDKTKEETKPEAKPEEKKEEEKK